MKIEEETRNESIAKVDKEKRYAQIKQILKKSKRGMTAKEIATELGYPERNYTAPRLTELKQKGIVETVGKGYDPETDRNVAIYKLVEEREEESI